MSMRTSRIVAVLGLALSFLLLSPAPSFACSCAQMATDGQVKTADVVVRGAMKQMSPADPGPSGNVTYTVDVGAVFKGVAPRDLEVRSAASGASCGLENVDLGREYVVFTYRDEASGRLWANLCGGTAPATPALVDAVERVTGAPAAPSAEPRGGSSDPGDQDRDATAAPGSGGPPTWVWPAGGVLVAAAAAGGTFLRVLTRRAS